MLAHFKGTIVVTFEIARQHRAHHAQSHPCAGRTAHQCAFAVTVLRFPARGDFGPLKRLRVIDGHPVGLEPQGDETIIGKLLPSAFHGTELLDRLQNLGSLDLIVCGFMSHSSVSTTVRAAKNLGFRCTLVEDACATRDLPFKGRVLSAERVQEAEMAIMADNFATLALTQDLI